MSSAPVYICLLITRADHGWSADATLNGVQVTGRMPSDVVQQFANIGFEIVSTSYSHSLVPGVGSKIVHVVWMRAEQVPQEQVQHLN